LSVVVAAGAFLIPISGYEKLWILILGLCAGVVLWAIAGTLLLTAAIQTWRGTSQWALTAAAATIWVSVAFGVAILWYWPTTNKMVAAAGAGDQWGVARALAFGLDVNAPADFGDRSGPTALTHAVTAQRWAMVRYLLERGADINRVDGDGDTPLETAALRPDAKMVERLLVLGARIRKDAQGRPKPVPEIEQLLKDYADHPETIRADELEKVLKVLKDAVDNGAQLPPLQGSGFFPPTTRIL